jgi:DNA-binding NarL/FixJ family response regulator
MKKGKIHTLFIVEDHEAYSFMLRYELERNLKYQITIFSSIEDCAKCMHRKPDLIILDCNIPGSSDRNVLEHLKGQTLNAPIVILTTTDETAAFHEMIKDRTFDYILKEASASRLADKLLLKIESILRGKEIMELKVKRLQTVSWVLMFFITVAAIVWFVY